MADQDYPTLYAEMEDAAQRTRTAAIAFEKVLGGDENLQVPVNGFPDQPTIARRVKDRLDLLAAPVEAAVETAKRFLGTRATPPTTRADGTPIQVADTYFNTDTKLEYLWNGTSWYVPSADGQAIQQNLAGPEGVTLVGNAQDARKLADAADSNLGAALLGRGLQVVNTIAALRTLKKGSASKHAMVMGFHSKGDGGGGTYYLDPDDLTSADDGGTVIIAADGGRWKLTFTGTVRPQTFGAVGDGVADDWAALDACVRLLRAKGGGVLDLGQGGKSYALKKPLRLYSKMRITGRGYLLAATGFNSTVVFPTFGTETPQTYNTLLYFNDGTHADDPGNFGYAGLEIDEGVEVLGNYRCDIGIILEGITSYRISGRFTSFSAIGVYAKYYCWGGTINGYIASCKTALLKLGEAANGVSLKGLRAFGDADTPTYGIQIVGDNNGIDLSGAFVEKVQNGIYWIANSGPASIVGVDFEDCFNDLIVIDGTGIAGGRQAGPITISGSFMEADHRVVRCINAVAIVTACRIRNTPVAFETSGPMSRVYDIANVFENTPVRAQGLVISDNVGLLARKQTNYLPNPLNDLVESYGIENKSYSHEPNLMVNGLQFSSWAVDEATKRMVSSSVWETRQMRNAAVYSRMGLRLNYTTDAKTIEPLIDNDHALGNAALRFSTVFAASGIVSTSDARQKTDVRKLDQNEIQAAKALAKEIGIYQWLAAVADKGADGARLHIGLTVQRAIEVLESHGLNPDSYGFICHDAWDAEGDREAGDAFGFRMDELLAFVSVGFEARLSDLEDKLSAL